MFTLTCQWMQDCWGQIRWRRSLPQMLVGWPGGTGCHHSLVLHRRLWTQPHCAWSWCHPSPAVNTTQTWLQWWQRRQKQTSVMTKMTETDFSNDKEDKNWIQCWQRGQKQTSAMTKRTETYFSDDKEDRKRLQRWQRGQKETSAMTKRTERDFSDDKEDRKRLQRWQRGQKETSAMTKRTETDVSDDKKTDFRNDKENRKQTSMMTEDRNRLQGWQRLRWQRGQKQTSVMTNTDQQWLRTKTDFSNKEDKNRLSDDKENKNRLQG